MRSRFRLPGPTPLPPSVLEAMQRPMVPHRGAGFKALYRSILDRTQLVHRTNGDIFIWPGSGSAGWEIAIVNLFSPGDTVLVVVTGAFGERFHAVATMLGLDAKRLDVPWGEGVAPEQLQQALDQVPGVRGVFLTHNETSTGVTNPIAELAVVAHEHDALVVVDAVSSAAGLPLEMDLWGLDYVMSGSQKAWMSPPGIVIAAAGQRCWDAYSRSTYRRFFWDFAAMREAAEEDSTPTTPPESTLYAFDAALDLILEEGIEEVWARHASLGAQLRAGLLALGLDVLAVPQFASNTVTAVTMPDGISSKIVIERLKRDYDIDVAAGQGKIANSVIRIGHMGWCDADDIELVLDALAEVMPALSGA
jgi:aspartate aminotransferase-like enzyme